MQNAVDNQSNVARDTDIPSAKFTTRSQVTMAIPNKQETITAITKTRFFNVLTFLGLRVKFALHPSATVNAHQCNDQRSNKYSSNTIENAFQCPQF